MNKLICLLTILFCVILTECKTSSKSSAPTVSKPVPEQPPVVTDKPAASDTLALAIASGHLLYQTKCKGCHDLPRVKDYRTDEWPDIMHKMSRKAHLSGTENDQILAYINTTLKE